MLSPELLKKIDSIFLRCSHRVTSVFAGEYESAFRGQGIEFEEYREYVPGDDVRQIDWNVTARMDRPFVKVFREEREQTIFFLVDVSASLGFGHDRSKLDVATEVAALLSYAAVKSSDKVGLIIFSDQIEKYIPPKKGRGHVWTIIAALLSHKPLGKKTNIKGALNFLLNVAHRRAFCFVISDLLDQNFSDTLKVVSFKHELVVMRIIDRFEREFPRGALMDWCDLETGAGQTIDLSGDALWYRNTMAEKTRDLDRFFGGNGIDFLDLEVNRDYVDVLLKYFVAREKRR